MFAMRHIRPEVVLTVDDQFADEEPDVWMS